MGDALFPKRLLRAEDAGDARFTRLVVFAVGRKVAVAGDKPIHRPAELLAAELDHRFRIALVVCGGRGFAWAGVGIRLALHPQHGAESLRAKPLCALDEPLDIFLKSTGNPFANAQPVHRGAAEADGCACGARKHVAEDGPRGAAVADAAGNRVRRLRELFAVEIDGEGLGGLLAGLAVVDGVGLPGGDEDVADANLFHRRLRERIGVCGAFAKAHGELIPAARLQLERAGEFAVLDLRVLCHDRPVHRLAAQPRLDVRFRLHNRCLRRHSARDFHLRRLIRAPLKHLPLQRKIEPRRLRSASQREQWRHKRGDESGDTETEGCVHGCSCAVSQRRCQSRAGGFARRHDHFFPILFCHFPREPLRLRRMKLIRVPWIRCRADEMGAIECEMCWRSRDFIILAYSENEAKSWWSELSESEREQQLGMDSTGSGDEPGLF